MVRAIQKLKLKELAEKVKSKELSPVDIVNSYLQTIELLNSDVNAFITIMEEEALKAARIAEKDIMSGCYYGPLHGIPIGLKDVVYTKAVKTTMGSPIYKAFIPQENAHVVDKLHDAGAIIIGKLNTHQFAYGPTGDRSYYGPVRNPYDLKKMSGGSSSGSAAAVATGMCVGAIGTDTSGSIRLPAAFCGIVGMKPTYGLVSKQGVYPLSATLDHIGPMTKTIEDNALFLNAIAGYDRFDFDSKKVDTYPHQYDKDIGTSIKDKVIGVPRNFYFENVDREIYASVMHCLDVLANLGATIIHIEVPHVEKMVEAQQLILRTEAYALHKDHLNDPNNEWDDEVRERLYTGEHTCATDYIAALNMRKQSYYEWKQLFEEIDAIITPTTAMLPQELEQREIASGMFKGQHIRWPMLRLTGHINLIGFPALALPCGISEQSKLPMSVQFIGDTFKENVLYQIGYALEQEINLSEALNQAMNVKPTSHYPNKL